MSLNSWCFLGIVCGGVSFLIIVIQTASDLSVLHSIAGFFSFLASSVIFWVTVFESTFGRLLLEQHFSFRGLVIRPYGLLQVLSLLSDNTLLKNFLQRSITWLYTIIVTLYHFYVVTFCIWFLYLNYGKNNQTNMMGKPHLLVSLFG